MVFSSLIFCTIFLPICLLCYYGFPLVSGESLQEKHWTQNSVLLTASLIFYAFGGIKYLFLIALVIMLNWAGGFLVDENRHTDSARRFYLILIIIADLGILFFFKYFNLFIATIENVFFAPELNLSQKLSGIFTGTGNGFLGLEQVVLPVGISFYIFQALSYVIDIYKSEVRPQKSMFDFALYISCFPQLIAGPIVQYKDVAFQISDRTMSSSKFATGIRRFCYGLAKKVLLANNLAVVVDSIYSSDISSLDAGTAWVGAICYTFQIYYDFSGYSDMAIGLGKMFGFDFKENFNYPYCSTSIREFWRRWHISLSSWFREYVYIPLGGSRCSMARTCFNCFIVFLLTGIWHGANWTFLVWGVTYGLLLILERVWLGKYLDANPHKFINRIAVFIVVTILWVVFRADNIMQAGTYISRMFIGGFNPITLLSHISGLAVIALVLAILFSGIIQWVWKKFVKGAHLNTQNVVCIGLLLISLLFLVNNTYNPFIYYQF